ncbi:MAG: hypothetical protein LBE12_04035 [Planctomycetaceae bacterium]|jgi:hypothetical protein|nr:hypothetical protein [Planctomycetaceae bacterium]
MTFEKDTTEDRTLSQCVIGDLIRYLNFCDNELHNENLIFVVFSLEPLGFKFPEKKILKTLKGKKLSKLKFQNRKAHDALKKIISSENRRHSQEKIKKQFIEFLNKNQDDLSPWCKQLLGIQELKQVLDSYMEGYNVGWNCYRIEKYPESLFYIELWIYYD